MPDEFPTLEAVAALGALIAAVRAYLIHTLAVQSARLHREVLSLLESGAGDRALAACESAASRAYPRVAEQVMRAAAEPEASSDPARLREQLAMVFESAYADEAQRIQSGRARDLIVLAVLLGAALYARASKLDVSQVFYALLGVGSALILWTVFSRRRVLDVTRGAKSSLIDAAARAAMGTGRSTLRSSIAEGCAVCGSLDSIVVTDPARAQLMHLGIEAMRICRSCGHLTGVAADPSAIPVGPEHGIELAFQPGEVLSEGEEPQG